MTTTSFLVLLLSYLLGAIPFGLLLTKLSGLGDVRKQGSGNIGATNVLRTGHKGLATLTLLLDGAKGGAAVYLALVYAPGIAAMAGFMAFMGHCFPIWLNFKGGKGVATFYGALLVISWQAGLIGILTWGAVAVAFRMSSLASILSTLAAPFYILTFGSRLSAMWAFAMAAVILVRHRENIQRIAKGKEPKIGQK